MDTLTHLKELCAVPGISGYEGRARDVIAAAWKPLVADVRVDRLGSLWATKNGTGVAPRPVPGRERSANALLQRRSAPPRPKLMLAAHMDAIGLMVTQRDGEFLRVIQVGGIDARVMPGQPVTVHGRRDLPGTVVQPPSFLLPKANREGVVPVSELLVDCGLTTSQLAEAVAEGDVISLAQPPVELKDGLLAANRLDNRASVAAVTACLDYLQVRPHTWDVVAVATVQEETRYLGAITSAFEMQPQFAIAIDVTHGAGAAVKDERTSPLGGGPVLGFGPNIHPKLFTALKATAERVEMKYSLEPMALHSGTDAYGIQVARAGIPTAVISIPLRNMHTPVEVVAVNDVQRVGRLLAEFITTLTPNFMEHLVLEG
ncbi:MAG: M42 family peptidase [Anaerolineales bacterium]